MEEGEKKRKRVEKGDVNDGGGRRKMLRQMEEEKEEVGGVASPTEEEVEEFFAILRRMHVAVKYFGKSNGNGGGDGRKLTEILGTALETQVLGRGGDDDVKACAKSVNGVVVVENGNLDLNAVPEDDCNSV